jgi:hypothetical protein
MPIIGIDPGASNPAAVVLDGGRPDGCTHYLVQLRVNGESIELPLLSDDKPRYFGYCTSGWVLVARSSAAGPANAGLARPTVLLFPRA